jgi:hypothetical protein
LSGRFLEMDKSKVALTFAIYFGQDFVRRETVAQDIVKVGKDPRSHLRVDDELASRMHAVIEVGGENDITLIDLGNEPGTLVNGQRVNKCKIRTGDQVQIGNTLLHLEQVALHEAMVMPPAVPLAATMPSETMMTAPQADAHTGAMPQSNANPFASQPPQANPFASQPPQANPFAQAAQAAPAANPFAQAVQAAPAVNPFAAAVAPPPAPPSMGSPFANGPVSVPPPANPFVAQAVPANYGVNAPGGSDFNPSLPYTYSMVRSGPDVSPDEVEHAHLASVEVMVMWDTNVLHVSHLTPPRSFFVGEDTGTKGGKDGCDFYVPSEALGTTRAPVVVSRGAGSAAVIILPSSSGYVEIPGQGQVSLIDLVSSGRARASSELSGAYEFELPPNAKARVQLEGGLTFQVSAVNAGKAPPAGIFSQFEPAAFMFTGLSFLLHTGIIASLFFFMPRMGSDEAEGVDRDQLLMMQKMLSAAAEREQEEKETPKADNSADNKEGGTGTRAKGEEGSMGNPNTKDTGKRFGVQGPQDNPDPHIARQAALKEAAEFGMIGLINTGAGGDPNAPTAPWGREESLGSDPMSARGNMWGDSIGDAFGAGGLGLSGVGEGGGGRGEGIGLGNIGTIGHGAGTGTGQGFGNGHGRLGGAHATKAPSIRQGATQVNGRLPPEVIQRIVRQNFGRFRLCYENGLRTNPNLAGGVTVRFSISREGAVSSTSDGGSSLPDQGVIGCVVRGFGNLSFPAPEGGIVTVVYPIIFNPGD